VHLLHTEGVDSLIERGINKICVRCFLSSYCSLRSIWDATVEMYMSGKIAIIIQKTIDETTVL